MEDLRVDLRAKVFQFLEIAPGLEPQQALQYLQFAGGSVERAIDIFLAHGYDIAHDVHVPIQEEEMEGDYDSHRTTDESSDDENDDGIVPGGEVPTSADSFNAAISLGKKHKRWVVVNLHRRQYGCYNALWSDEVVEQMLRAKFIICHVYVKHEEGVKLKSWYKVEAPSVLIIDPITGAAVDVFRGSAMNKAGVENISELLVKHVHTVPCIPNTRKKASPSTGYEISIAGKKAEYPDIPQEEPRGYDVVNVCLRIPDSEGYSRMTLRKFKMSDPIQYLWGWASAYTEYNKFMIVNPIKGKTILFNEERFIGEEGIANSTLTLVPLRED